MEAIHNNARINMVVDPLGDTVVHYWTRIADRYGLYLAVVNEIVDPTFHRYPISKQSIRSMKSGMKRGTLIDAYEDWV
jgi:phosphoglucomutase